MHLQFYRVFKIEIQLYLVCHYVHVIISVLLASSINSQFDVVLIIQRLQNRTTGKHSLKCRRRRDYRSHISFFSLSKHFFVLVS